MLTLTPVVCVCGGILVSEILSTYLDLKKPVPSIAGDTAKVASEISSKQRKSSPAPQETSGTADFEIADVGIYHLASKVFVVVTFAAYLSLFVKHCTYVTSTAYSSPSVVLASRLADGSQYIIDDYREAYYWLRMNTPEDARVMSWSTCLKLDLMKGGTTATKLLEWQIVQPSSIITPGTTLTLLYHAHLTHLINRPLAKQCHQEKKFLIQSS